MALNKRLHWLLTARLTPLHARVLDGIYLAGAGALVFVLPYYVPMKDEVFAYSYDFGFNNRVAILGALVSVLAAPFFVDRDAGARGMSPVPENGPRFSKHFLYVMVALHTVGLAFSFLMTGLGSAVSDLPYFLSSAIDMSQGLRPYKDFEYAYGPGLLYPIHWLAMTGLPVHTAYFVFYLILTVGGLYLAWSFADLLPIRTSLKTLVFLLPCGISLVSLSTGGVNYTIVRFLTPLWVLAELNEGELRRLPVWREGLIACAGICVVDLISPEIGTVLAITVLVFFAFTACKHAGERSLRLGATFACACVHVFFFFVLMPPEFRSSMVAFGHGGLNLPVVPSPMDGLYLLCFASCFKLHMRQFRHQSLIFPLIILFSLGTMAGALTHADAGHVAWDGIGIFGLAVIADGSEPGMSRRMLAAAPVLLFAVGNPYLLADFIHLKPLQLIRRVEGSQEGFAQRWRLIDREAAFAAAFPSSAAPLSTDYELEEKLALINLKPSYYFAFTNAFDVQAVARKIDDLRNANPVILAAYDEKFDSKIHCLSEANEQQLLSLWLTFPYTVRRVHDSCRIYEPFFAFIQQRYRQMPSDGRFWVNKAVDPTRISALASGRAAGH